MTGNLTFSRATNTWAHGSPGTTNRCSDLTNTGHETLDQDCQGDIRHPCKPELLLLCCETACTFSEMGCIAIENKAEPSGLPGAHLLES